MARTLVVKATAGIDAPERCSQAFTVAATAAAAGVPVSLWLTGESAWFALPGRAAEFDLPHADERQQWLYRLVQRRAGAQVVGALERELARIGSVQKGRAALGHDRPRITRTPT